MTRNRVSKEEKQQRHEWAMKQIEKGVGFSELASLTSKTWGGTRRQARTVVKEAHKEWLDGFNDEDINQRDLLFQCLGRLERTAEESGNFACVIGAVQLMNRMMALGTDSLTPLFHLPEVFKDFQFLVFSGEYSHLHHHYID